MNNTTSDLQLRYPTRTALLEEFMPMGQMMIRVVPPIWYAIGFIGNPISAAIWLGQRMRRNNSSAIYLGALSISDLVFLFLHLLMNLHYAWEYDVYNEYVSCEIFNFLYFVPQYLSVLLVLGFTAERYVAVCHPFLKGKLCTVKRAIIAIVCLVFFSLALSSGQIYIWTFSSIQKTCVIRPEAGRHAEQSFSNIWPLITENLIFGIVPLIVLVFNILVLVEIFKISRNDLMTRQQNRNGSSTASTVTLLTVSFYLILTQLSATIVYCLHQAFPPGSTYLSDDEVRNDTTWRNFFTYHKVRIAIEVMCLSHYSCYFFIYCVTGKHFRKEVLFLGTLKGRLHFFNRRQRKEQYSMVSTNGGPISGTYTTAFSTAI